MTSIRIVFILILAQGLFLVHLKAEDQTVAFNEGSSAANEIQSNDLNMDVPYCHHYHSGYFGPCIRLNLTTPDFESLARSRGVSEVEEVDEGLYRLKLSPDYFDEETKPSLKNKLIKAITGSERISVEANYGRFICSNGCVENTSQMTVLENSKAPNYWQLEVKVKF